MGLSCACSRVSAQAGGDAKLLLDEVEPVDELGDRVLNLQARVHLQKEEVVRVIARGNEFDGADALVAAGRGQPHGRGAQAGAQLRIDDR